MAMDQPLFDRVRVIAADVFHLDSAALNADSSPETIEAWDSVQNLNLVLALEQEFGFEFAPEEMDQMKTIGQIATVAAAKRNV
jgi:acyl carrier protein